MKPQNRLFIDVSLFLIWMLILSTVRESDTVSLLHFTLVVLYIFVIGPRIHPKYKSTLWERKSFDGIVIGKLEQRSSKGDRSYMATVKRIYEDGVFHNQEEFTSKLKAENWLNVVYSQELANHYEQVGVIKE